MDSKRSVRSLIVSDDVHDRVLFDADIGDLVGLSLGDGGVLEVRGVMGVLRVDLSAEELETMLSSMRKNKDP
jgi:hypothetical protein